MRCIPDRIFLPGTGLFADRKPCICSQLFAWSVLLTKQVSDGAGQALTILQSGSTRCHSLHRKVSKMLGHDFGAPLRLRRIEIQWLNAAADVAMITHAMSEIMPNFRIGHS